MAKQVSQLHYARSGRDFVQRGALSLTEDSKVTWAQLSALGIGGLDAISVGMDTALTGPAPSPGGFIPRHLLQTWLPGVVRQATRPTTIDELVGMWTVGSWEDEEIVFRTAESIAKAELYGDHSNIPLASYTNGTDIRTVVRFEQGFQVSRLEDARQAKADYNVAAEKRVSAEVSLDLARNLVGYNGYAAAGVRTFGLLNDPALPAYQNATASWSTATFDQIVGDVNGMMSRLRVAMGGLLRDDARITFALPIGTGEFLNKTNSFGMTVKRWLTENYPNLRVVYVPEFVGANGGANVAYLWVDEVEVTGNTATNQTIVQLVPARFQVVGTEQRAKGYIEDFTNATAGVAVTKPYAVQRLTGL